jgi:hypothetical protein
MTMASMKERLCQTLAQIAENNDHNIDLRAFMGGGRPLSGERILERSRLSEVPRLDNVEMEANRKMLLCAPHKVRAQPEGPVLKTGKILAN